MEVISKTFAGTTRAGRCGCVCRSTDNTHDSIYNSGYHYAGWNANCRVGNTVNDNTNWSNAINHD